MWLLTFPILSFPCASMVSVAVAVHCNRQVVSQPGPTTKRVSGYALLNNHAVNFVSATLTAAVGAAMAYAML